MATIERHGRLSLRARTQARAESEGVRDLMLVGLTFASGAVDAISFLGLGKVFSAFMTGNLVFLGLGAAGAAEPALARVAVALAAFAAGVFAGVRLVRPTKGSSIWPGRVSLALGAAALAEAAFLVVWILASGRPSSGVGDLLIAFSALGFGLQSGAVMSLDVKGVFTTAATATIIMLASDEAGSPRAPAERRRLVSVVLALVAGAAAGGFLLLHARHYAPVLPLVTTLAVIATASVALRPATR